MALLVSATTDIIQRIDSTSFGRGTAVCPNSSNVWVRRSKRAICDVWCKTKHSNMYLRRPCFLFPTNFFPTDCGAAKKASRRVLTSETTTSNSGVKGTVCTRTSFTFADTYRRSVVVSRRHARVEHAKANDNNLAEHRRDKRANNIFKILAREI